jgi:PAS domain S-box-containing protein
MTDHLDIREDCGDTADAFDSVELGTDYLVACSPRLPAPESLKSKVLSRIESEPARVTTDAGGCITAINPAFSGLCGYSFDEIRGKKPGSFLQGEETDPKAVEWIRESVRNGKACVTEMINYHKNGARYLVRLEIEPLLDEAGKITGFHAIETKLG